MFGLLHARTAAHLTSTHITKDPHSQPLTTLPPARDVRLQRAHFKPTHNQGSSPSSSGAAFPRVLGLQRAHFKPTHTNKDWHPQSLVLSSPGSWDCSVRTWQRACDDVGGLSLSHASATHYGDWVSAVAARGKHLLVAAGSDVYCHDQATGQVGLEDVFNT